MSSNPESDVVLWWKAGKNASSRLPSCPWILPNRTVSIYPGLLKFSKSTTLPGNNVCPVEIRCETSNLIHEYNLKGCFIKWISIIFLLTCLNTHTKQEMNWERSQKSNYQQQKTKIQKGTKKGFFTVSLTTIIFFKVSQRLSLSSWVTVTEKSKKILFCIYQILFKWK